MAALPPKTLLKQGAYRVEEVLGNGGFGITYRAFDVAQGRFVAIKECYPTGCVRNGLEVCPASFSSHAYLETFKSGFRDQASRLRKLHHPAIVELFECFEGNNTVYLVMQLLEGPTLLHKIESEGAIESEVALSYLQVLSEAITRIHDAGFLHLDIKPENIILVEDKPVLVDFDLLLPRDNSDFRTRPLTLATQVGTPGYAPLEQYSQNAPLSAATDIYALGATLYHLLTGQPPLAAVDRAAGVEFASQEEAIPPLFQAAISQALALKSSERPQTIPDFLAQIKTPVSLTSTSDNEEDRQPVIAQGSSFYRVALNTSKPIFPSRCACCAAKKPTQEWTLKSPSGRWQLPLCDSCLRHQQVAKQANYVTFWGIAVSVLCAALCVGLSIFTLSFWPILLGFIAIMINFTAMSYGGLKNSRADEMLSVYCCDASEPATYLYNGRSHIWRFRNVKFAESFREANDGYVV